MHRRMIILTAASLLAQLSATWASETSPLFAEDSVVELSIEGPFGDTFQDRKARDERPFVLHLGPGNSEALPLAIRVRGKSRAIICSYAPLRLNFDPEVTAGTLFEGQNKLKLVLPCENNKRAAKDVLEEYAAYRIFNLLSEWSYRVRLLRIRLVDSGRRGKTVLEGYAFLLESDADFTRRTGVAAVDLPAIRLSDLAIDQAATVFIFEYMVGNTDWSMAAPTGVKFCCHNIRLFGDPALLYAVPYDFDQTGLVNAPYARPDPGLHLRDVTQRRYRGYCVDPGVLGNALDRITAQRAAILRVLPELSEITGSKLDSRVRYLEAFFKSAADRDDLLDDFAKRCL